MSCVADATAEEHLSGHPVALDVLARVRAFLEEHGPVEERVTRSQVAFRRRHGFAWIWLPGRYLHGPQADCVLSVALDPPDRLGQRSSTTLQPASGGRGCGRRRTGPADRRTPPLS